jgi:hypothetical protein
MWEAWHDGKRDLRCRHSDDRPRGFEGFAVVATCRQQRAERKLRRFVLIVDLLFAVAAAGGSNPMRVSRYLQGQWRNASTLEG